MKSNNNRFIKAAFICACLIFVSTVRADEIKWEPICEMNGEMFPSYLIAFANQKMTPEMQAEADAKGYLGDPLSQLSVKLVCPADNTKVVLRVESDTIISDAEVTCNLEKAGREYRVFPKIAYKFAELEGNRQAQPLPLIFKLSINGGTPAKQVLTARLRAINDCPTYALVNGKMVDYRWMFAAYVNEDHPWVDEILKRALATGIVGQFDGYQRKDKVDVERQILAIWTVFQRDGIKYSSIGTVSAENNKVVDQHVRFFDEVIREKQANCVDGTVLFASILRKIGLRPKLVVMPGHMLLVVQLEDGDHSEVIPVETTAIGAVDADGKPLSFAAAVKVGIDKYKEAQELSKEKTDGFRKCLMIDVAKVREKGISAIPYTRSENAKAQPNEIPKAGPTPISGKLTIPAKRASVWTFSPPGNVPGVLSGHWTSEGKSAGIAGAMDDTLIAFKLTGANSDVLLSLPNHPTSGNFSIRCDGNGKYTFTFDNGGIIRSSARNVVIDATFQPD